MQSLNIIKTQKNGGSTVKDYLKKKRLIVTSLLVILSLFLVNSCSHQIIIKDEGIKAIKIKAGVSIVAPVDGWFMSNQAVTKMLDAETKCKAELEKCRLEKDR